MRAPSRPETTVVADLYRTVTDLNGLVREARTHQIEVTFDLADDHVLDGHRSCMRVITVKIAKLLSDPRGAHG